MKLIFFHNFTVQYVNKSILNVKVLQNKNLVVILALKTAQILSKIGQETRTSLLHNFALWRRENSCRELIVRLIVITFKHIYCVFDEYIVVCSPTTERESYCSSEISIRKDCLSTFLKDEMEQLWESYK